MTWVGVLILAINGKLAYTDHVMYLYTGVLKTINNLKNKALSFSRWLHI